MFYFPSSLRRATAFLVLVMGLLCLGARPTAAQTTPTDNDVNRVASQLFCPTCESTPVDVCPTQTCSDWRTLIRQKLAAGESDAAILDYFATHFGPQVLANPPREGFGWLLWITPLVIMLAGALLLGRSLRNLRHEATAVPPTAPPAPLDQATRAKLEEKLNRS